MPASQFTITIHMVASLDGFIANKENTVSWFETNDHYDKGVTLTHDDMQEFVKTIDCYVMGANTYLHALQLSKSYGWPYGDVPTIVTTHRQLRVERSNVELYSGDLDILVEENLRPKYKNVWVVGGAILTNEFLGRDLADEIRMTILPVTLGGGTLFFNQPGHERTLHLLDVKAYQTGSVELHYQVKK